jgi:hypothetical protein
MAGSILRRITLIPAGCSPIWPESARRRSAGNWGLTQSLTQAIPVTMINVTTLQPYTSADGMTASALNIS